MAATNFPMTGSTVSVSTMTSNICSSHARALCQK